MGLRGSGWGWVRSVATAAAVCTCLGMCAQTTEGAPADPGVSLAKLIATGRDAAALEQIKGLQGSGGKIAGLDRLEGDADFDVGRL